MTPKEKAEELFDAHMGFKMNPYDDIEMTLEKGKAKEHALISVNLLLSEFYADDFYTEVKQEIEKL
jgi:hypothetical protein